jgi:hypothetical protein
MFNFILRARKALLASALVLCSGLALASPNYLVTIHTQDYSGESGLLDFGLENYSDSMGVTAKLWNFTGQFSDEFDRAGNVDGSVADRVTMTSGRRTNYLTQSVILGGDFTFNITFGGDYETMPGSDGASFAVVLYDAGLSEMLFPVVQFDLVPAFLNDPAMTVVSTFSDAGTVSEVPEPSQLLLMLSALAIAAMVARRKLK